MDIKLKVNGVSFEIPDAELTPNELTCDRCILNSNYCGSICMEVNREMTLRGIDWLHKQ